MKPGDVSAPFWTDKGLHIIRLDEKTAVKDMNEITEEAKKSTGNKLFVERYNAWLKGLRERAFIEIRL
jgi:parvulin-like peptidyl-prolyl isomerase